MNPGSHPMWLSRDAQHESVLEKGFTDDFCRGFGGGEVNTLCPARSVPVMATPAQKFAPLAGALRRRRDPPSPSRLLVPHVMAQVTSVPAADQTVGSRNRMTVSLTCEAERVGIKYSRIRLYTYPSLEIWGSGPATCVLHTSAGSTPAISATGNAPLSRVEHCHSNRRRFAFVGQRGARRYRCHSGGNDREVS